MQFGNEQQQTMAIQEMAFENVMEPQDEGDAAEESLLSKHDVAYNAFKKRYNDELFSKFNYSEVCAKLKEPIKCVKYNYSLEEEIQNHLQFDGTLQLSEDGQSLLIVNKKPNTNPDYMFDPDPHKVKQAQEEWKK